MIYLKKIYKLGFSLVSLVIRGLKKGPQYTHARRKNATEGFDSIGEVGFDCCYVLSMFTVISC